MLSPSILQSIKFHELADLENLFHEITRSPTIDNLCRLRLDFGPTQLAKATPSNDDLRLGRTSSAVSMKGAFGPPT